jgi:hypothetical protein
MLELPFQAKMTDRLGALLRRIAADAHSDDPDALPSFSWCRFESGPRAGTWDWSLQSFSRKFKAADDIFTVGDISVHVAADERLRLAGRVLDWIEDEGLVAYDNAA